MKHAHFAALTTKFRRFDWEERRCLAEAMVLLLFTGVAVRSLPLAWLGKIASKALSRSRPVSADRVEVLTWMVGWAVDRAAKRSPLRAKCFEQGLAAQVMLRRRGIDSTMFYGVGLGQGGTRPIHAHVWVETDRFPVIGAPDPGGFALMATWPAGRRAIWADCQG